MAHSLSPRSLSQLLSLIFIFSAFFSSASRTRTSPPIPKTNLLDVSASLQQALSAISLPQQQSLFQQEHNFNSKQNDYPSISSSSSSPPPITLQLHSRDSIRHPSTHRDYKTLTLSRLARDSARVQALNSRLALALSGLRRSDLKPLASEAEAATTSGALEGPIVSGTSQGSGEYFSRVGVGRPPKPLYMVLDTGSDVTWVQCQPCTDCYQQADPVFEPASSSSFSTLSCQSQPCKSLEVKACRNDSCLYQVSYGDGSYTVGDFVTETLTFGDSASVENIALGCGHDNEGLFVGAAGLLGLGGGALSFPSQISASSFSYCLVDRDSSSSSTLQFSTPSTAPITAPITRNSKIDTFYYVALSGISVGGRMLSLPPSSFAVSDSGDGGVILDSGTAITRLQSSTYAALRDNFVAATPSLPRTTGVALFDTCYDLSSRSSVEVPTVALHFPAGQTLSLPAKNFLIPVDSSGTFCFAFAPTSGPLSIIGNVQQQGTRVGYDLRRSLVGFTPNDC